LKLGIDSKIYACDVEVGYGELLIVIWWKCTPLGLKWLIWGFLVIILLHGLIMIYKGTFLVPVGGAWDSPRERITYAYSIRNHTAGYYLHF
jgi:hypothetical protein